MLTFLALQFRQGRRWTEWWFHDGEFHHAQPVRLWWPPRLSNILLLFGLVYFVADWVQHPPMGTHSGMLIGWCEMLLGFVCRQYEY